MRLRLIQVIVSLVALAVLLRWLSCGDGSVFCFGYCCPSYSMSAMQRQREYARGERREWFQAVLSRLFCLRNLMEMREETLGFISRLVKPNNRAALDAATALCLHIVRRRRGAGDRRR